MKHTLIILSVFIKTTLLFGQVDSAGIKKVDALIEDFYGATYKNSDSAIVILDTADALSRRINYSGGITAVLRQRGMFYTERSDYVRSLGFLFSALKEDEKLKNDDGIGMDLLYIGLSYFKQGKMDEALSQLDKALLKYTEMSDEAGIALINANMGMVYRHMNRFDDALKCYFQVRTFYIKEHNDKNLSSVENNIGNIYKDMKEHDKALEHFITAEILKTKVNDLFGLIAVYSNIADIYVVKKEFSKAFDYYYKALKIAEEQKSLSLEKDVYFDLANAYHQKGDYKQAYDNYKRSTELKDSIISDKYNSELADMKVKYESEKKEKENNILKKENELQDVKIVQEKKQKALFASLAILVFIAGSVVFKQYKNKQKLSRQLAKINEKVNNQNSTLRTLNTELIESEENLTKANASKDQLISILSHDLYNPVTSVINYTNQIVDRSDSMGKKELKDSFLKVNSAVIPLQDLLDNILQWARTHKSKLEPGYVDLNINKVIDEIIQLYKPAAAFKSIKIDQTFSGVFVLKTDRLMLYFILRNIVNNAVKFCNTGKQISIDMEQLNQRFVISIKDEGKGFDPEIMEQLNLENQSGSLISTHGSGIGLSVSRQFVKLLDGKIEFKNSKEGGGEVKLTFPVI